MSPLAHTRVAAWIAIAALALAALAADVVSSLGATVVAPLGAAVASAAGLCAPCDTPGAAAPARPAAASLQDAATFVLPRCGVA